MLCYEVIFNKFELHFIHSKLCSIISARNRGMYKMSLRIGRQRSRNSNFLDYIYGIDVQDVANNRQQTTDGKLHVFQGGLY